MTEQRTPSQLDRACDTYVHNLAQLSPLSATAWGIHGHDGDIENFSPEYYDALATEARTLLATVMEKEANGGGTFDGGGTNGGGAPSDAFDEVDTVTAAVLKDRLGVELAKHERGEHYRDLNNIASPIQFIRDTLNLTPTRHMQSRLAAVPAALDGYKESLRLAASRGNVAALRQINDVITQCRDLATDGSMLEKLGVGKHAQEVPKARAAFGKFADWLHQELAPHAPTEDAVGRERYELFSHEFVGARVDLDDAYEWGLERLAEITAEQERIAAELYGSGVGVKEAMERLNKEERYQLHGTDALKEWMQGIADKAISDLNGTHFDIPEPVTTIECLIDPAGTGGIFYTPPTDDFSRPGQMWWSVPAGEEVFYTWQELTCGSSGGISNILNQNNDSRSCGKLGEPVGIIRII